MRRRIFRRVIAGVLLTSATAAHAAPSIRVPCTFTISSTLTGRETHEEPGRAVITVTLPDSVDYSSGHNGDVVKDVSLTSDRLSFCLVGAEDAECGDAVDRGGTRPMYVQFTPFEVDLSTGRLFQRMEVTDGRQKFTTEKNGHCDVADLRNAMASSESSEDSRSEEPGLVVEEAKTGHSPRPAKKASTIDAFYACQASEDKPESKRTIYYSTVADVKVPKSSHWAEDVQIQRNWKEYVTAQSSGNLDGIVCNALSYKSMDEAVRKQRDFVDNMSEYHETVSLNYSPHL